MTTFQIPFDEFLSSAAGCRQFPSQQRQRLSQEDLESILSGLFGQASNDHAYDQGCHTSFSPLNLLLDNINGPQYKANKCGEQKASTTESTSKPKHDVYNATPNNFNVKSNIPTKTFSPPLDLYETESSYYIYISLPGISQSDINIDYEPSLHSLTISGVVPRSSSDSNAIVKVSEISYGKFERIVKFSKDIKINDEEVTAKFNNGLLIINFPKIKEIKTQKRRIIVGSGSTATYPATTIMQQDKSQVEEQKDAKMTDSTSEDNDNDIYQTESSQESHNNSLNLEKDPKDPEDNWDIVDATSNGAETISISGDDSGKKLSREPSVENVQDEEFFNKSV